MTILINGFKRKIKSKWFEKSGLTPSNTAAAKRFLRTGVRVYLTQITLNYTSDLLNIQRGTSFYQNGGK
jgi:hypothetical protein